MVKQLKESGYTKSSEVNLKNCIDYLERGLYNVQEVTEDIKTHLDYIVKVYQKILSNPATTDADIENFLSELDESVHVMKKTRKDVNDLFGALDNVVEYITLRKIK